MHTSDIELQRFGDYRPTQFDRAGLGSDGQDDWLVVPLSYQPACAELLEESNWETAVKLIGEADPTGEDYEIHYFGHWTSDFKIIVVRPGSAAHREAQAIASSLAGYPILDESDFSERECEAQYQSALDELHRLELRRRGKPLGDRALNTLAYEICQRASSSETLDRSDIERALERLGWQLDLKTDVWRAPKAG